MCIARWGWRSLRLALTLFFFFSSCADGAAVVSGVTNRSIAGWIDRKNEIKARKLDKLVSRVASKEEERTRLMNQKHFDWSSPHNPKARFAIFAVSLNEPLGMKHAEGFIGTARKTGFNGDIVVGLHPNIHKKIQHFIKTRRVCTYGIDVSCSGKNPKELCTLQAEFKTRHVPIAMLRYYIYLWWALQYSSNTVIMIADFRDVFFQSDPFTYKFPEWKPPLHQMTVFQEFFPNKVISRCGHNRRWIRLCYGEEGLGLVESNTALCSGISIGTKNAIVAYTFIMLRQLNASIRIKNSGVDDAEANEKCYFQGMDQGLHNWLVYTGLLDLYMNVKIYQQGEGPVNTVGAFMGKRALINKPLREWGILKGDPPNSEIFNWNNELSPVVHQLDRFQNSEDIKGGYRGSIRAFQSL